MMNQQVKFLYLQDISFRNGLKDLHEVLDCTEDIGCLIEPRQDHIEEKTLRQVESQLGFPFGFLGHNCWSFDFHSEKWKTWD